MGLPPIRVEHSVGPAAHRLRSGLPSSERGKASGRTERGERVEREALRAGRLNKIGQGKVLHDPQIPKLVVGCSQMKMGPFLEPAKTIQRYSKPEQVP